jgi:hypothetical protein
MKTNIACTLLFLTATYGFALTLCYNGEYASFKQNCIICPSCSTKDAFTDSQGQNPAFIYCEKPCPTESFSGSCVNSGSYNGIYTGTFGGTCVGNVSCQSLSQSPLTYNANTWVKYIDNANPCPSN